MTKGERQKLKTGLMFVSPWIIGFLVFTLFPVGASLYYSFCDYDILTEPLWIGTLNYQEMFTDEIFWKTMYNTLYFAAFSVPLGLVFSLLVAVLLNQAVKCKSLFRLLYYLPSLVPMVAGAMIWLWVYNGKYGLLNYGLKLIGIDGPLWLTNASWTKPALIFMGLWGIGNTMVIYLAALQDVPIHLYESAEIDGAGFWVKLRHITIPLISPVIYFNMVMGIIGSLQIFAVPYVMMRNGGPDKSALFYAVYLFENAFRYNRMGYACAMAWILFILIVVLTWFATKATRKHIHYGAE